MTAELTTKDAVKEAAELARKDAVKETVRRLAEYMRDLDPPLVEWRPTEEFVEKYLLDGAGTGEPEKIAGIDTFSWTLKLKRPNMRRLAAGPPGTRFAFAAGTANSRGRAP